MGFVEEIAPLIQKYAPMYGIKVCSPIIAQAILESNKGTSELAKNAHNYFGLKYRANRCPSACGIYYKVGSEQNKDGSYVSSAMQWMKFSNMENGVKGYFDFINVSTYANLKGVTDPKTYLINIKADKYATSLNYVDNLMNVINSYNLTQYDGGKSMTKIAIDAGHGSQTSGKRTPDGYREHWINVKTAYYCEQYLKSKGIETIRIGWNDTNAKDDADVALSTRQKQIKNANCDYSISFHANAYGNGWNNANGVETLIHSNIFYRKDSKNFATKIQNRIIQGTKQTNRGVKTQSLAMCNCVAMGVKASALVEIGFMTNKYEANLMKTDTFCKEQGEDVAKGICDYLGIKTTQSTTTTVIAHQSGNYVYNGLDYSLVFDPKYYASKNQDLIASCGDNTNLLFNHFIIFGMKEGRQAIATFNVNAYKNRYKDLRDCFGNDLIRYYQHYITNGYNEKRNAI